MGWFDIVKNKKSKKHPALTNAGVSGFSKPKRTPKHKTKSHVVVVKDVKRGKMSAAYWSNKVKWNSSKTKEKKNKNWRKGS